MTEETGSSQSIADEYRELDFRDRIVLLASAGAFLLGFLPWYSVSVFGLTQSTNGFVPWHGKVFFLTSLATVCLLLLPVLRQQLLNKLSPDGRALTIPVLTAISLIFGPVFALVDVPEAFAGVRDAGGASQGLVSGGNTWWLVLAFLATAAAAGMAFSKWKQSATQAD